MAVDRRAENQRASHLGRPGSKLKSKDPFDFDAPRFTDFTRRKYRLTKRLLDQIVLKQNVEEDGDEDCPDTEGGPFSVGSSELSEAHWFAQAHSSHEPTSPLSPTGPLLSPGALLEDDAEMGLAEPETPASPSARPKLKGTPYITGLSSDYACMSPNVSMVRPGGLRSKPGRVLTRPTASSSLSRSCAMSEDYASEKSPSGLKRGSSADAEKLMDWTLDSRRTPLVSHVTPKIATSPISRFMIGHNRSEVKRSSPMKRSSPGPSSRLLLSEDTWTDGRISSLPSLEGWLASSSGIDSPSQAPQVNLPSEDPSPMKVDGCPALDKPAPFIRKLGMASRATRIQISAPNTSAEPSTAPSPTIKRMRTDAHNFTATAQPTQPQFAPVQKKGGAVKIEDLKKILAEHNQRLRTRKR